MPEDRPAFRVSLPGVGSGEDILGVWQSRPAPQQTQGQAFSGPGMGTAETRPGGEGAEATVWQINLPADALESEDLLKEQERRIERAEQALPEASQRLERYIAIRDRRAGSYSVMKSTGPEAILDAWIGPGGAASFGGLPRIPQGWEETARQANALFKQLGQAATYAAWIETASSGVLVGRTTVGWSGDLRHFWLLSAAREQASLHQRSLELALRSKAAWIKMMSLVLSGGLKLAVLAPTGPVAGIPAALQFISQIVAQAQELRAIRPPVAAS